MTTGSPEAVKKLLESMQGDLRSLSMECRKKFPPVKEVHLSSAWETSSAPYMGGGRRMSNYICPHFTHCIPGIETTHASGVWRQWIFNYVVKKEMWCSRFAINKRVFNLWTVVPAVNECVSDLPMRKLSFGTNLYPLTETCMIKAWHLLIEIVFSYSIRSHNEFDFTFVQEPYKQDNKP